MICCVFNMMLLLAIRVNKNKKRLKMAEKLDYDKYSYDQVDGKPGVLLATKYEDGSSKEVPETEFLKDIGEAAVKHQYDVYKKAHSEGSKDAFDSKKLFSGMADKDKKYARMGVEDAMRDLNTEKVNGHEVDRSGFPRKAEWTSLHDGKKEVTVLGIYKDKIDGKVCYQIHSDEMAVDEDPIPADELEIESDPDKLEAFKFKEGNLTTTLEVKIGSSLVVKDDEGNFDKGWKIVSFRKNSDGEDLIKVEKEFSEGGTTVKKEREETARTFAHWLEEAGYIDYVDGKAPPDDDTEDDPATTKEKTAEALKKAKKELSEVRKNLVDVTIRRRARMNDKYTSSRTEDVELYNSLMEKYKDRLSKYLDAYRNDLEAAGIEPGLIDEKVIHEEYKEKQKLITLEFKTNNNRIDKMAEDAKDKNVFARTWAKRGKFLRKWANMPTWAKVGSGLAVGAIVATGSGALGLGLAGLAVGSAAKFSLGLINRKASVNNVSQKRFDREIAKLKELEQRRMMMRMGGEDPEQLRTGAVESTERMLNERVRQAQRLNKIGNLILGLSGLVGGYGIAELAGAPGIGDLAAGGVHGIEHGFHDATGGIFNHGHHVANGLEGHGTHPGNGLEGGSPTTAGAEGGANGGAGTLYYHGMGHEAAVKLPNSLHFAHLNGHDAILDKNNTVVYGGDAKHEIWSRYGRLDKDAIRHLKALNYKVTEPKNVYNTATGAWHFMTEVS